MAKLHYLLVLTACLEVTQAGAASFHFTDLTYLNRSLEVFAVNNAGTIAGSYCPPASTVCVVAYTQSNGIYTTYADPTWTGSDGFGINNSGQLAGDYFFGTGNQQTEHGFIYTNGTYTTVERPTATASLVLGINDSGAAVGQDSLGAFTYFNGVFTPLAVPSATGATYATGIANSGEIVGHYGNHGFTEQNGIYTTVDFPGADSTQALAINNLGEIAGFYNTAGHTHGFIERDGAFLTVDDPNAAGGTIIHGINDSDEIVGYYLNSNGSATNFSAVATPEPASFWLLAIAVSGLFFRKRRMNCI